VSVTHLYLDTSVLMRYLEGSISAPEEQNRIARQHFQELIDNPENRIAMSEITIMELHNVLGKDARSQTHPEYDNIWRLSSIAVIMNFVSEGRIQILKSSPKWAESALTLMKIAHEDFDIQLEAWDAAHFVNAFSWAVNIGQPVKLATGDKAFRKFIGHFPSVIGQVEILMIRMT
jgi:predicted nucleic acid-binding protein